MHKLQQEHNTGCFQLNNWGGGGGGGGGGGRRFAVVYFFTCTSSGKQDSNFSQWLKSQKDTNAWLESVVLNYFSMQSAFKGKYWKKMGKIVSRKAWRSV